jgi:hypothetical protein
MRQAVTKVIEFHKVLLNRLLNNKENLSCLHNLLLQRNRGKLTSFTFMYVV